MDRAVNAAEILLTKLEEERRLERMMEAFDQIGPTMKQLNRLLADPSVRRTFVGADRLFNDPATRRAMRAVATTFDSERIGALIQRMEQASERLAAVLSEEGAFQGAVDGVHIVAAQRRLLRADPHDQLAERGASRRKGAPWKTPSLPKATSAKIWEWMSATPYTSPFSHGSLRTSP